MVKRNWFLVTCPPLPEPVEGSLSIYFVTHYALRITSILLVIYCFVSS